MHSSKILRPAIGTSRVRPRVLGVQARSWEQCTRSSASSRTIDAIGDSDCHQSCKTLPQALSCFPQRIQSFRSRRFATPTTEGRTAVSVSARSYHHRAAGYLAGLHSYQPPEGQQATETAIDEPPDFESFESAWEALQSVPTELLNDFEEELWETQSKKFVYGTKHVSVIDAHELPHLPNSSQDDESSGQRSTKQDTSRVFRYLILNERPNKIQTVVEVPFVGAPYHHYSRLDGPSDAKHPRWTPNPPTPISQTHQGGLAMALPFWYKANGIVSNEDGTTIHPPNCLLIGAGGCSLAHTLSACLFLDAKTQRAATESDKPPVLNAVEASLEILEASKFWFGASSEEEQKSTSDKGHAKPPFFDLVHHTGESYLKSLLTASRNGRMKQDPNHNNNNNNNNNNNTATNANSSRNHQPSALIDVLIIDAEDGSAPPHSMRTSEFWNELVLPCLNFDTGPVVGVNAIGSHSETSALVQTMSEAFRKHVDNSKIGSCNYTVIVVTPPSEAKITDRHKLVFALPSKKEGMTTSSSNRNTAATTQTSVAACWNVGKDDMNGLVDVPRAWEQQVQLALEDALDKP